MKQARIGATPVSGAEDAPAGTYMGFWTALSTALMAVAALAAAVTTPARSGTYCLAGCIRYPYTAVAGYVPRDYLWMYPALLAPVAFVLLAAGIHTATPARPFGPALAGLCLSTLAAGILVVDYGLQLSVVQPSLLAGEVSGLSLISQYNPHGIFIGLENTGYAVLAASFVCLGAALIRNPSRRNRPAGWVLVLGGALNLLLLVALAAIYRNTLDVRFEVPGLAVSYLVLAAAGVLACISFSPWRRERRSRDHPGTAKRNGRTS